MKWFILTLCLLLGACGGRYTISDHTKTGTPKEEAQKVIKDLEGAIAVAYQSAMKYVDSGALTVDEYKAQVESLNKAAAHVDQAQLFLDTLGDVGNAQTQLELAQTLLNLVQAKLIEAKKSKGAFRWVPMSPDYFLT